MTMTANKFKQVIEQCFYFNPSKFEGIISETMHSSAQTRIPSTAPGVLAVSHTGGLQNKVKQKQKFH